MENKEIFTFKYGEEFRSKRSRPIQYKIDDNNCWICVSHLVNDGGYPMINVKQKPWRISRWSYTHYYEKQIGEKGNVILHSCDNRLCINPLHLSEGTHADNVADMVNKGRQAFVQGEDHGFAKLTEENVISIFNSNLSRKNLAKIYNVHIDTVASIQNGRTWKHLNLDIKKRHVRLKEEDVIFIRKNCKIANKKEFAKMYNVSISNIERILRYDTWKEV